MTSPIAPEGMASKTDSKNPLKKMQRELYNFMESAPVQLFLITCLMLSLFLSDSWTLGNAPDSDNEALYSILIAIIIIFTFETTILTFVQSGYYLSFFFWMDIVGTLSIFLDVGWIASLFLPSSSNATGSILRATRAAKLGARYGRLIRLFKLMRFLKYLPCFASQRVQEKEPTMSAVRKVSNELSSVLSLRVAALVMILVIVVPFLGYNPVDNSGQAWANTASFILSNNTPSDNLYELNSFADKMNDFFMTTDTNLVSFTVDCPWLPATSKFIRNYKTRDVLREDNRVFFKSDYHVSEDFHSSSTSTRYPISVVVDSTYPNSMDALYGIIIIILVIFVLFSFSASFQNAVDALVVTPLERMMTTLRKSATVMLKSMKVVEDTVDNKGDGDKKLDDNLDEELETEMLEKMVDKLARIVSHMMPGGAEIEIDQNIDKATAAFLQNFSQNAKKPGEVEKLAVINEKDNALRIQELDAIKHVVDPAVLNSWEFDVLNYDREELIQVVTYIFAVQNCFEDFQIPTGVFHSFVSEIASRYIDTNTYHNFKHGCDVLHTSYRLMLVPSLNSVFSRLEFFSLLVAALAHDVGHLGVNNVFLIKAKHELALLHNDRSPLENMHCAVLYEVLSKNASNIFIGLTDVQWRDARKVILTTILGTDMSHHFEQISKSQVFLEVNGDDIKQFCSGAKDNIDSLNEEPNRLFVLELVLHCSDISNPFKPFKICARWADLVVEEFSQQGDREKREGMEVSPMMDRELINLCNMQMGFIEFVVTPLINSFVNIFPTLNEIGYNMQNNFECWGDRRKLEIKSDPNIKDKAEDLKKMDERIEKFKAKMSFLGDLKHRFPVRRSSIEIKK